MVSYMRVCLLETFFINIILNFFKIDRRMTYNINQRLVNYMINIQQDNICMLSHKRF